MKHGENMKKIIFLLFLLVIINNVIFSQEEEFNYYISNIDTNFIGYYVSIDFLTSIENYKSYAFARNLILENTYYAHIIVYENNMIYYPFYSDCYFEVTSEEFIEFEFKTFRNEITIIDQYGNKYKKMTNSVDYKIYQKIMENYIGNIVLIDFIKHGKIIIDDDNLIIPSLENRKFLISTWLSYGDDVNMEIYDEIDRWMNIEINNNELIIYKNERRGKIIICRIEI